MKYPLLTIALFLVLNAVALIILLKKPVYVPPTQEIEPIQLTNTDTIYQQIDSLEVVSDTIKIYYEKKIQNYRILPTPQRVRLFAERINR
tara:strand:+ start:1999 stop:2268 length:270 start_codon:yes stop_codon:yes gene_type:complete